MLAMFTLQAMGVDILRPILVFLMLLVQVLFMAVLQPFSLLLLR